VTRALAEDLGPVLIFAPRRQMAESLAAELMRQLPNPNPLQLSPAQKQAIGEHLAKMLKSRVAYHHSGLSYGARAGVIEPLAKAGQLRVVVATMGLAAGINFSLRSVALAGDSYRRDELEQPLRPDEILQMFGRAGRRGIDETGYILITANQIRLLDAHACHLSRNGMVDWSTLLSLMHAAASQGREPFAEAVRVQERLFTFKPIFLGVEHSLKNRGAPCGLMTDAERARHVRKRLRQMLNSRGEWEACPAPTEKPLREVYVGLSESPHSQADTASVAAAEGTTAAKAKTALRLRPALTEPSALEKTGTGTLCVVGESEGLKVYGRSLTVAEPLGPDRVVLAKWICRLVGWNGRQAPLRTWHEKVQPLVERRLAQQKTPLVRFSYHADRILALVSVAELTVRVPVDSYGVALWNPASREVLPADCANCGQIESCRQLSTATGTALLWRRLGLVDAAGAPTRRGRVVSFFSQGDGLAVAAALEDETYPIEELVYDLANLDAGFRFCGEDNRWAGRLTMACHQAYGLQSIPGYLENGLPPRYGAGAEQIVANVHRNPLAKQAWVNELLGTGDIDRVIIEWRSLLRQVAHAPDLEWARWRQLQQKAKEILGETQSPTLTELPPLEYYQTKRVEHRLILRRY
jgi:hypothetical protein